MSAPDRAKLYIGTSGWSYPDWGGIVYPKSRKINPLEFIAQHFNAVEINTTFYHPVSPQVAASWVRHTHSANDFHFTAKLWQRFTHETSQPYSPSEVTLFSKGIEPLAASGRLGGILIQFPWSFQNLPETREHILKLCKDFGPYNKWVEVRHISWDTPEGLKFFEDHGLGFVNIDQPISRTSIRPSATLTSQSGYVRLHGRNAKAWFDKNADRDQKYNYLYSGQELDEWVEKIQALRQKAVTLFAFLNNHYRGQAPANALQLMHRLTGKRVRVPESLAETYPELQEIALVDGDHTGQLF